MIEDTKKAPDQPAVAGLVERSVGRLYPKRVDWRALATRTAMPVRCEICAWRGRRLVPRSKPCPACGSRVEFA